MAWTPRSSSRSRSCARSSCAARRREHLQTALAAPRPPLASRWAQLEKQQERLRLARETQASALSTAYSSGGRRGERDGGGEACAGGAHVDGTTGRRARRGAPMRSEAPSAARPAALAARAHDLRGEHRLARRRRAAARSAGDGGLRSARARLPLRADGRQPEHALAANAALGSRLRSAVVVEDKASLSAVVQHFLSTRSASSRASSSTSVRERRQGVVAACGAGARTTRSSRATSVARSMHFSRVARAVPRSRRSP